ncbi:MAG: choice-of-anchor D domain-containing protein [bacterium]|nr:choice-of-anchor D domain-containing protein [Myxococcales bacterium]MCB9542156.1 choice-of-anchor D domain-containing protein [Myxococcales bacterium]
MSFKALMLLGVVAAGLVGCDDDTNQIGTAEVQLTPNQFLFPKLALGSDTDRVVEVRNIGSGQLIIASIRLDVDNRDQEFELYWKVEQDGNEFRGITRDGQDEFNYPVRVDGGESLFLVVNYQAVREQPVGGTVVLETNAPDSPTVNIPVVLQAGAPEIAVNPRSHDFDRVPAGETEETRIQVTNIGQLDLTINRVLLNGDQDFKPLIEIGGELRDPRQIPDGETVALLEPGRNINITVRYSPLVEGPNRAELVIFSNDPVSSEVAVSLTANGATPCLQVNPPALEFRTSLVNRTDSRPMSIESCGGAPIEITRVYLEDADPAFELVEDSLPMLPAIMPAYAQADRDANLPPPSRSIEIAFTPREERIHNGKLIIESNDPVVPRREVPLLGRGVTNACPQARAANDEFYVVPLDVVVLDGSPSIDQDGIDARPVAYEWVITSRPDGSVSQPHESFYDPAQPANGGLPDDIETPTAVFFVDLAGTYTAELRVRDNLGLDSIACENPAVVTIVAKPEEAIHVQLVWRTPADDDETDLQGTDLDLHLLHPVASNWFDSIYDCHYANPIPDWGQIGNSADDPSLDIDDINGAGPENINLDQPEPTEALGAPYLVGVHYYNSRDRVDGTEYGPSFATVRIFIEGELSWDFTDNGNPGEKEMQAQDHFWDVAQISWPSGDVVTRDRYYMARP